MPAWGMHLYIANELNKVVKLDKNEFLIGNVLSDIYSGWIIKDASKVLNYDITHYSSKKYIINGKLYTLPDYDKFIKENIGMKNSALFIGYLSHLITDYYFNNYVFKNHYLSIGEEVVGIINKNNEKINCDKDFARESKQRDFNYFSYYLINKIGNIKIIIDDKVIEDSLKIKHIDIQEKDLYKVEKYLNNLLSNNENIDYEEEKYTMLSKKELEKLVSGCIDYILKVFKEYLLI